MTSSSGDVLNIKNLSMRYPKSNDLVLDGFSLKIRAGERVALIGSSGSGKSTIAKALMQILPSGSICKGELLLNGKDILRLNKKSLENIRGELVGFVFQDPRTRLNPLMTVGEHILDTLKAHKPNTTVSWRRKQAKQLLLKVGIDPVRFDAFPHEFSGGMCQRLAISLAIALNPPLLIADEPTSSLDVEVASNIMAELTHLCDVLGMAFLLISHDLALASKWCNRMAILEEGRVIEEDLSRNIIERPKSVLAQKLVHAARAREGNSLIPLSKKETILEIDRLRCWHSLNGFPWQSNWVKAVDEISFSLSVGETLGVVGVSGCGKSTLCRALLGLVPTRGGQVKLYGQDLERLSQQSLKKARQALQMVFQDPFASMNPKMTVLQIIADPLLVHKISSKSEAKEKARKLLDQVGLTPAEHYQYRLPHQLSGGQQQRVAIARALALNPKVLICDESVSMLDADIQSDVLQLLRSLQQRLGLAILFITHDLSVALGFCHRIVVLDKGKIVEEGPPKELFSKPQNSLTKKLVNASPRILDSSTFS